MTDQAPARCPTTGPRPSTPVLPRYTSFVVNEEIIAFAPIEGTILTLARAEFAASAMALLLNRV